MECSCTVNVDIEEPVYLAHITTPFARRVEICSECNRDIHVGEDYRKEIFYHGSRFTHRTCEDCLSIREVFFSSGWYYGEIREQMEEFVYYSDGQLSVKCILELTKKARDWVLDIIESTWEEDCEVD
jgi:hypothetical protein